MVPVLFNHILACIVLCTDTISGMRAEACKRGASEPNEENRMLSRVFIGYGKMADHVIYLPNSCLIPRPAPSREEWSMGGDGPSILGPTVYFSASYQDIRCPPEELNIEIIQRFADDLVKNDLLPVRCANTSRNLEIAFGIILVATGYPTEAYNHFNKISIADPSCPAVYYGRALAYAKSGLSQHENAVNALGDYNTALKYAKSHDEVLSILERRAEVYHAMGKLHEANVDYSQILEDNDSDPSLYMHRGSVLFLLEEYAKANTDFERSLQASPDQPVAMHYQALCLYNMGRLREAVKLFQDILRLKPDYTEIIQSLGQAYQELGEFDLAIENFNKALSVNPTDARSYHYRGILQYQHGDPRDALTSFKTCIALEPFNEQCRFMKGASLASVGQYYPAVKEFTKVMLSYPSNPNKPSSERTKVMYLREWCRYMHCHLESSLYDVTAEVDLPARFREYWVNSRPFDFTFKNYTEQPGIQPHIKDVEVKSWEDLSNETQTLLCKAHHIGSWVRGVHGMEAYKGNKRLRIAMGMASLQIAEVVSGHFKSSNTQKTKQIAWRVPFDIAVKWKRLVDVNHPVMWLDKLPNSKTDPYTFIHHINLMKGDKHNMIYSKYIDRVISLMKNLVLDHTSATSSNEYKGDLEQADDYGSIVKAVMKHNGGEIGETGFSLGTKVPSVKDRRRKHLDGFTVSIGLIEQNNTSVLAIDVTTKRARTLQYHAELDFIWDKYSENMSKLLTSKKSDSNIQDSIVDSSLLLAYYFYNLMPISDGSGVISHATTLGLLLAIGKEVTGGLDSGKVIRNALLLTTAIVGVIMRRASLDIPWRPRHSACSVLMIGLLRIPFDYENGNYRDLSAMNSCLEGSMSFYDLSKAECSPLNHVFRRFLPEWGCTFQCKMLLSREPERCTLHIVNTCVEYRYI